MYSQWEPQEYMMAAYLSTTNQVLTYVSFDDISPSSLSRNWRVYAANIRANSFILQCDDDPPENPGTAAENANGGTSNATRLSPPVPIVLSDSYNAPSALISPPIYPFHKVVLVLRRLPLPLPYPLTRISPEPAGKMMKLNTAIAVFYHFHAAECVILPTMHVNLSPLYPRTGQFSRFPPLSTMRCRVDYQNRHFSYIT